MIFDSTSSVNSFEIKDKIILVTGGTRGLGRSISLQLARCGAHVVAGYFQNEQAAENLRKETAQEELKCDTVRANLMTSSGIQSLADHITSTFPRLDALVYSSATGVHKPLEELSQRHLLGIWQVNVGAFFELCQKLRSQMPAGSRIVAISSEGARRAVNAYGAIGSSKAALEALCRQMAAEWACGGISVNVVAPGLLQTDTLAVWHDAETRVRREIESAPLRRIVRLEEVALLVHFLCSAASEGIVGQTLIIDGGKSISTLI